MTAAEIENTLAVALYEDLAGQQLQRAHEMMARLMREHRTAEGRTFARLQVLRLEKAMLRNMGGAA